MLVKGAGLPFRASDMDQLRPFQRRFVKGATAPGIDTAALSLPRGNGKSWLAAYLLVWGLSPGDSLTYISTGYIRLTLQRLIINLIEGGGRYSFPELRQPQPDDRPAHVAHFTAAVYTQPAKSHVRTFHTSRWISPWAASVHARAGQWSRSV